MGNYVRRSSFKGSQRYAEALKAHKGDFITVPLAAGARVTVPKALLDLDMVWLESHDPWINWRSKTLGETHNVSSGALGIHEPTVARK
uniref:Uncharacterized protein n=1 Tax=Hyaloperonospora arabidopsidis (strain Emoy2) TaxID=559515 RepID=M4BN38_HYAAE